MANRIENGPMIPVHPGVEDFSELKSIYDPGDRGVLRVWRGEIPLSIVEEQWDKIAEGYHEEFRDRRDTTYFNVELPEVMKLLNRKVDGAVVLDAGCGAARFIPELFHNREPKRVIGLDISSKMLELAEEHLQDKPYRDRVDLVHCAVEECSSCFEPASMDVVLALNLIHLVPGLDKAMREFNKLLKLGGRLVALTKHPKRNEWYATSSGQRYEPGLNNWYLEYWPGSGEEAVWVRYMTVAQWNNVFTRNHFVTNIYEPEPTETVAHDHPELLIEHQVKGSGLIVVGTKFGEVK
jgi:SAM-dependent methyltransferase